MSKIMDQLVEFHDKFNLYTTFTPSIPLKEVVNLRDYLITEEYLELSKAITDNDLVGIADGLADLVYVLYGAALAYGINLDSVLDEVHRSNMTKVWPDGTVHYNDIGKVLKPDTYSPPDIKKVL